MLNNEMSRTEQAVRLVLTEGISKAEAARRIGLSRQAVCAQMSKMGMGGFTPAGRLANRERGVKHLCTPDLIAKRIDAYRREIEEYRVRRGIDVAQIVHAHFDLKWPFTKIAYTFGLTKGQVAGYCHRHRKLMRQQSCQQEEAAHG